MLNGRELIEKGVITGKIGEKNVAQHGVDLNLSKVERLVGPTPGRIPNDEGEIKKKTLLTEYEVVPTMGGVWALEPGTYSIIFEQGCKIPADMMLLIRQRSSLLRNGTILHSSVFDAGFETGQMGTVMIVNKPIVIERGARVAQIYGHACTEIDEKDVYGAEGKGSQWQGDNQRENK